MYSTQRQTENLFRNNLQLHVVSVYSVECTVGSVEDDITSTAYDLNKLLLVQVNMKYDVSVYSLQVSCDVISCL